MIGSKVGIYCLWIVGGQVSKCTFTKLVPCYKCINKMFILVSIFFDAVYALQFKFFYTLFELVTLKQVQFSECSHCPYCEFNPILNTMDLNHNTFLYIPSTGRKELTKLTNKVRQFRYIYWTIWKKYLIITLIRFQNRYAIKCYTNMNNGSRHIYILYTNTTAIFDWRNINPRCKSEIFIM